MRLFVGIELTDEVKDYIYKLQNSFKKDLAKIKWVSKKNLHLTIKFLGEVDKNKLEQIYNLLSKVRLKSFKITLNKIGVFSQGNLIKVIWIDVTPAEKVIDLQRNIDYQLINLFSSETNFTSHITIGRVKSLKDRKEMIQTINNINIGKIESEVNSFNLFESSLTKDGPKYKILRKYQLS